VPVGKAPRSTWRPRARRGKAPLGLTLQGRLIVVVEDEAAVREGLVVLLQAWGASVLSFDTVEALQAWLAGACRRRARPAAGRLPAAREGRTGIDALVALRARWPAALPAIMITGSSLGGHEDEA
jgi:CheY-like chemotaxis protein